MSQHQTIGTGATRTVRQNASPKRSSRPAAARAARNPHPAADPSKQVDWFVVFLYVVFFIGFAGIALLAYMAFTPAVVTPTP